MAQESYSGRDNLEVMADAKNYNRMLVDLIERHLTKRGPILDFGAGIGTFDDLLRDRGYQVACLEVDQPMVKELAARGYQVWSDSRIIPDQSMAGIFSLNVFEHIEDDQAALKEAVRILAPGGMLLVYVPAFATLTTGMDRRVGHFRRYRQPNLVTPLRRAGLAVRATRYVDTLGFAATLAYKIVGDPAGSLNPVAIRFFDQYLFPLNRWLDPLFGGFLGKNLLVVAEKPKG